MRRGPSLFGIIYFIIGILIAYSHGYFANLFSISGFLSAALAILLWPLVLFGVKLTIGI